MTTPEARSTRARDDGTVASPLNASPVRVVTDTAASLPPTLGQLRVVAVPLSVVLGGDEFADGTLEPSEVLRRSAGQNVATSAPSPGAYLQALEPYGEGPVLIATVSATMSASYDAAVTASSYRPAGSTVVLDTKTAAGAQGLVVLAAARAAAAGLALDAVAAAARRAVDQVRLLACLEDLSRLAASGRVPGVAVRAGRSFGVRTVFEFVAGSVRPRRPARSTRGAVARMLAACGSGAFAGARLRAAVLHAEAPEPARLLEAGVHALDPAADVYSAPFSSVMVAHTGGGLYGLAWWWEP